MKKIYKIVASLMLAISANQSFSHIIWNEHFSTAAYVKADCDTYSAPFIETFSTGSLPLCWASTSSNTVANGLWKFSGVVDYAPGNSRPNGTFAWVDGSDPSNISDVTLTSPWIDVSGLTAPTLFFDYFSNNLNTYPNNIIKVEAREQAGAWAQIYADNTNSYKWRELEIPLPALSGTVVQVRFIVDKTAAPAGWAFYNDILLDNVGINEPSACPKPTSVTAIEKGANSIDVTWTPGGSESAWNIVWGAPGFTPGDANQIGSDVSTTDAYTITGLSSSTTYDIYVQADCAADGTSEWVNFLEITTSPACGDVITDLCYGLNNAQQVLLNFTATPGSWAELVFLAGGVETCCDEVLVYDGLNGTGNIIYGALTGGGLNDYSGVAPVVSPTGQLSLVIKTDGSNTCSSVGYTPFQVKVNCVAPPTCLMPSALTLDEVTVESIAVSWTAGDVETEWNVVWGPTGFTPGDASQLGSANVTSSSYLIDGLAEDTGYDVYVRAVCDPDDSSSWTVPLSVATLCESISVFPWAEDFEQVTPPALPACWGIIDANHDANFWRTYINYGVGSSNAVGLYTDYHYGDNDDYLILPRFSLTGSERLKFSVRARSLAEPNDYRVVLSTTGTDPSNFTHELQPLTVVSNTTHEEIDWIDLRDYTGDVYIAIHVPSGGLDGYYIYLDNFMVDHFPCPPVSALATTDITHNSATLEWISDGSLFDMEVVKAGETPTGIPTYAGVATPFTITDLEHSTAYEFYVRQDCGYTQSDWTGPLVVTTLVDPCYGVSAPVGNAAQEVPYGSSLADLVVSGDDLRWYTDDDLQHEVDVTAVFDAMGSFTRYVTQTIGECTSEALAITVTVTKAPLTITVNGDQSKVYGENDPVFAYEATGFKVLDDESVLSGKLDREPGEDVGTYVINQGDLEAGANYEINFVGADFAITKAAITGITFAGGSFVYDGSSHSLAIAGTLPTGASVSYLGNSRTDAGIQTVTAEIDGGQNYESFSLTAELEVTKAAITGITFAGGSFVYDGSSHSLAIAGTLPTGASVSYLGNSRTDAGIQTVTAEIDGGQNYESFSLTAELEVTKVAITGITFAGGSFVYDGSSRVLAISGTLPTGASVSYLDNSRTDAGIQTVTAEIDGGQNYESFSLTAELEVTQAAITGITFAGGSFVYDGSSHSLAIAGTLPTGASVSYLGNSRTDAGIQMVTAEIDGGQNYESLSLTAELEVTKAAITGITFAGGSFVYDGSSHVPAISGTLPTGASVSYLGNSRTDAGIQTVTAEIDGGQNYESFSLTAELEVTKAAITGITFAGGSFVYDGTPHGLSIGGTLPTGASVSYLGNSRTDAGIQTVTAEIDGGQNYESFSLTAELEVTKAAITGITFAGGSFVYDGTPHDLSIGGTLPTGASVSYLGNSRTDAGVQTVTAEIGGGLNYESFSLTAELEVTKAAITGITFADGSFVYDGSAHVLAISGTLPTGASISYLDNSRADAGTQMVTATVSGSNYETLVLTASLTITPATRTLDFPGLAPKIYGDTDFEVSVTASSGEAISYISSNTEVAEITSGGLVRIVGAGEATITATLPENTNYVNRPQASHTLRVGKATQTITLSAPGEVNRDAGTVALTATASSGLPVSLSIDDAEVATLSGTMLNIRQLGTVRITARQAGDGNHEAAEPVTVVVRVIDQSIDFPVRVSRAVSPNGDGINDYLVIEAIKDHPENRICIFNRNGTVVYEASGYNNGTVAFRGVGTGQHMVPQGTYFYVAEIRKDGEWMYDTGWFALRY